MASTLEALIDLHDSKAKIFEGMKRVIVAVTRRDNFKNMIWVIKKYGVSRSKAQAVCADTGMIGKGKPTYSSKSHETHHNKNFDSYTTIYCN